jgi:hypothetical protein
MQLFIDSSSLLFCEILNPSDIACKHSSKCPILSDEYAILMMQWFILFEAADDSVFSWNRFPISIKFITQAFVEVSVKLVH